MISTFVGRKRELDLLEKEWQRKRGSLIILYGRRRIGKTRLLAEFIKDKSGIFYVAEDISAHIQIARFKERIADFIQDQVLKSLDIKDWDQLFAYFVKNIPKERFYLCIDEFSYLIKNDKSILSTLQRYWDSELSSSNICILLSGSMLGLMSEMVLSHASPLYGRRTRDILLEGLPFSDARKLLSTPFEDSLKVYMVIGGVPEYLIKASEYKSLYAFLENEFFDKYGYFYREPYFIISQEFRELNTYFSILDAVALRNTKPTEIANFAGMETRQIYPYLENLIRLGFLERRVSLLGTSKKGIYLIKDHIFDFWFNFVSPNKESIERESFKFVPELEALTMYFAKKFELLTERDLLPSLLPQFPRTGRWWHKTEEIDIVAVNEPENAIAFLECKWRSLNKSSAENYLKTLEKKAPLVKWKNETRKEIFGLLAREVEGKKDLHEKGYLVFDLEDFEKVLS
ncbi:MAG TPA: ATP-binding protein [Methanosarcina sp.]|nr:ATP-binding protein [Methanosarcina sp.]